MAKPLELLHTYWGYTSFKASQEAVIDSILAGKDTLALLPTGGGKSICYQIPALALEGICIVVSPLIALIQDQTDELKKRNIKAIALTGGINASETDTLLDNCIYGSYKFLYLSPEKLQNELVIERIKQMNVSLIAIDEAHCISQWGNDFRPAYLQCNILKNIFPEAPLVALTATATEKVQQDILSNLTIPNATCIKNSFFRPEVAYMTFTTENKHERILQILKKNTGSSILYVRNRKATLDLSNFLKQEGFTAAHYHGGLPTQEKTNTLRAWLDNTTQVMVATNAFGMGINKPDVRTVIHFSYPESIESYFQEAGRGGRDGKKAFAVLFKNEAEEQQAKQQFLSTLPDTNGVKLVYQKLNAYCQIAYQEGEGTTHAFTFQEFCAQYNLKPGITYNALRVLDKYSIISLSEHFQEGYKLQFIVTPHQLESYSYTQNANTQKIIQSIIRTYGGIFEHQININLHLISAKTNITLPEIKKVLGQLEHQQYIKYSARTTDAEITFLIPREDQFTINRISKQVEQQLTFQKQRLQKLINFINNDTVCKSIQLLHYFGENTDHDCGICSVCIAKKLKKTTSPQEIKKAIVTLLEKENYTINTLSQQLNIPKESILECVEFLIAREEVFVLPNQMISISKK